MSNTSNTGNATSNAGGGQQPTITTLNTLMASISTSTAGGEQPTAPATTPQTQASRPDPAAQNVDPHVTPAGYFATETFYGPSGPVPPMPWPAPPQLAFAPTQHGGFAPGNSAPWPAPPPGNSAASYVLPPPN